MDNANDSELQRYSFPELREITDFLLFYRVNGVRTLASLFPNLTVIRGQNLFYSYALVLFEMPMLQEVGLYSLTDIMGGSVRIDKNPQLCYINTIDWDLITYKKGENYVKSIKLDNECPVCPGNTSGGLNCPEHEIIDSTGEKRNKRLCWNKDYCQKICPSECKSCNRDNQCCHETCLGGCEKDIKVCHVCRNISIGEGSDKQCMKSCPSGQVEVYII